MWGVLCRRLHIIAAKAFLGDSMASSAKSLCRHAGCGVLIAAPGRCDKHKKQMQVMDAAARGTAHERGYTSAWGKARAGWGAEIVADQRPGRVLASLDGETEISVITTQADLEKAVAARTGPAQWKR